MTQSPLSPRPALMTRVQFEAVWDGELVLMPRRTGELLGDMNLASRDVDY
jgi:hypothetical protein